MWYRVLTGRKVISYIARNTIGTITNVSTQEPLVALTFDDGPHPEYTPRLLDLLNIYSAKVTFFMVGESAQNYPKLINRIIKEGHSIGNHSWDHTSFPTISSELRRAQIRACQKVLGSKNADRIFRPPYGHQSIGSRIDALMLGYKVIAWNHEVEDWSNDNVEELIERLIKGIRPGAIVLLHDALYSAPVGQHGRRDAMLDALDTVIQRLIAEYRFVTIPELLNHGKPIRSNWFQKGDPDWLGSLRRLKIE